jgi:hypothetical protein
VPYDRINDLKLLPPKNSNVDFDLTIKGVVKDTAILTDASGQTHTVVNEKETGSQSLHVDLVGVVDEPHFDLNTTDWTQDGNGYSITIQEDGRAPLDFKLTSGSGRIPRSITRKPSTWCWKGCRKGPRYSTAVARS